MATASAGQDRSSMITLDEICLSYGCISGVKPRNRYVRKLRVLTLRAESGEHHVWATGIEGTTGEMLRSARKQCGGC